MRGGPPSHWSEPPEAEQNNDWCVRMLMWGTYLLMAGLLLAVTVLIWLYVPGTVGLAFGIITIVAIVIWAVAGHPRWSLAAAAPPREEYDYEALEDRQAHPRRHPPSRLRRSSNYNNDADPDPPPPHPAQAAPPPPPQHAQAVLLTPTPLPLPPPEAPRAQTALQIMELKGTAARFAFNFAH